MQTLGAESRPYRQKPADASTGGVHKRPVEIGRQAGFGVADGTCPLVRHAHDQLRLLVSLGYFPIVIGKRGEHAASAKLVHAGAEEDYEAHNTVFHTRLYEGAHSKHILEIVVMTRSSAADATPSTPQTTLRHQCMP